MKTFKGLKIRGLYLVDAAITAKKIDACKRNTEVNLRNLVFRYGENSIEIKGLKDEDCIYSVGSRYLLEFRKQSEKQSASDYVVKNIALQSSDFTDISEDTPRQITLQSKREHLGLSYCVEIDMCLPQKVFPAKLNEVYSLVIGSDSYQGHKIVYRPSYSACVNREKLGIYQVNDSYVAYALIVDDIAWISDHQVKPQDLETTFECNTKCMYPRVQIERDPEYYKMLPTAEDIEKTNKWLRQSPENIEAFKEFYCIVRDEDSNDRFWLKHDLKPGADIADYLKANTFASWHTDHLETDGCVLMEPSEQEERDNILTVKFPQYQAHMVVPTSALRRDTEQADIKKMECSESSKQDKPFPSIREFITDPYYLGKEFCNNQGVSKVYPYWINTLEKFYESGKGIGAFYGCIGGGKSVAQLICMMYDFCRLQAQDDPRKDLEVNGDIDFVIMSYDYSCATDHYAFVTRYLSTMPFIQKLHKTHKYKEHIEFKPLNQGQVKSLRNLNVAGILIEDINIGKDAQTLAHDCYKYANRNGPMIGKVGHLLWNGVLKIDGKTDQRLGFYESEVFETRGAIWDIKSERYTESETFTLTLPKRETLEIPIELKEEFDKDMKGALESYAGIGI